MLAILSQEGRHLIYSMLEIGTIICLFYHSGDNMLVVSFLLSTAFAGENCNINMSVDGMSCAGGCPVKVTTALKSVDGVLNVTPDFDDKSAKVEAEGKTCKEESHPKLIAVLKDIGYKSKVVSVEKKKEEKSN